MVSSFLLLLLLLSFILNLFMILYYYFSFLFFSVVPFWSSPLIYFYSNARAPKKGPGALVDSSSGTQFFTPFV